MSAELVSMKSRLKPIGGTLAGAEGAWFNYVFFPPTKEREWSLQLGSTDLATIVFPAPESDDCSLASRPPFRIVACGMLVVADWRSSLRARARITYIEADIRDRESRTNLGFFLMDSWRERGRLNIRFGFHPPNGKAADIRLVEVLGGDNDSIELPAALRRWLPIRLAGV